MLLKRLLLVDKSAQSKSVIVSLGALGSVGAELRALGFNVQTLNLSKIWQVPKVVLKLTKLTRNYKPDIIHTWLYHADLIGTLAAIFARVKLIIWGIHTTEVGSFSTAVVRRICAMLSYFFPSRIMCIAEASKNKHISIGYCSKKIQLFHNGLDFSKLQATKEERDKFRLDLGIDESAIVVGSLGRFHPVKGYDVFINAAVLLLHEFRNVRFLLIGKDLNRLNEELIGWINSTGFTERFILLGERSDVAICLSAMDIFCLHSRSEGLPTALAEGMAMALPCVATDVGDAGILLGNTGVLVKAVDPEVLANGLKQLITLTREERSRIGRLASERVRSKYTIEKTYDEFSKVYSELIDEKGRV